MSGLNPADGHFHTAFADYCRSDWTLGQSLYLCYLCPEGGTTGHWVNKMKSINLGKCIQTFSQQSDVKFDYFMSITVTYRNLDMLFWQKKHSISWCRDISLHGQIFIPNHEKSSFLHISLNTPQTCLVYASGPCILFYTWPPTVALKKYF